MGMASHGNEEDWTLVNHWLQELSRRTGVGLRLDDEGVCTIGHESGLDCVVEVPGNGSVYLRVALLPWEPEENPHMAERCLLASFMGVNTGGAAFGVDPVDAELILWQERPLVSLNDASFYHLVTQILDNGVLWRLNLTAAQQAAALESADEHRAPLDFSTRKV